MSAPIAVPDESFSVCMYVPHLAKQCLLYDLANVLSVEALLKMCRVGYKICETRNAQYMSPGGYVPLVQYGNITLADYKSIVKFFSDKLLLRPDCVVRSSSSEFSVRSNMFDRKNLPEKGHRDYIKMALCSLIKQLEDYEKYICWLDASTYLDETKSKFSSVYPFPLNYLITMRERQGIANYLREKDLRRQMSPGEIFQNVVTILNVFSLHLNQNFFLSSDKPKSIDALLFGHLTALIRNRDNPRSPRFRDIAGYILNDTGLVKFIETINSYIS